MQVALLWAQYAAYHMDRCSAVAQALGDRGVVHAIELATTSHTYAWEPSGAIAGCRKTTLFPGANVDEIGKLAMFRRQFSALRRMDLVLLGIPYSMPVQFLLALCLRLVGVRIVIMNDSKFDDLPRRISFEWIKRFALVPYHGALVAGSRHADYLRFLGFGRPIAQGYDTVSLDRLRADAALAGGDGTAPHAERPFIFVGRFVPKKGLDFLLAAYGRYRELAGESARRLVLAGSGPLKTDMERSIAAQQLEQHVVFPGFLTAPQVARLLSTGLALVLPSREEQWGLVVNEALAVGLPVIVSEQVGARDMLVRNMVNGFVIEQGSTEGLARAMLHLHSLPEWHRMAASSSSLAPDGDVGRFAAAALSFVPEKFAMAARP